MSNVLQVPLVPEDLWDGLDGQDLLEEMDRLDLEDHKVSQVKGGLLGNLEIRANAVNPALLDNLDRLETQDQGGHREHQDSLVKEEMTADLEIQANQDNRAHLVEMV